MTLIFSLKNTKILSLILSAILFSLIYLIFVANTFAQTATSESPLKTRVEARKEKIETRREKIETAKEKRSDAMETRKEKLDANRLRVCERKEKVLTNRIGSLTRMTINMLEKFSNTVTRVKEFYINKVVPADGVVSNYDELVADIDAAKANVDNALTNAKTNADSFTCTGDDPKGTLTGFKEDMQTVKSALHDYRTSIKNLLVAVKTAAGGANE